MQIKQWTQIMVFQPEKNTQAYAVLLGYHIPPRQGGWTSTEVEKHESQRDSPIILQIKDVKATEWE